MNRKVTSSCLTLNQKVKPHFDFASVSIEKIDQYIENFYEEPMERKVEGAMALLFLCFSHENMEYML